jgi:hypothetical protein
MGDGYSSYLFLSWIPGYLQTPLHMTVLSSGFYMNFFNNLAAIVAPIVAGFIFGSTGSFAANFFVAGAILVLGIVCFLFSLGRIEQIQKPQISPAMGSVASTS